MNRTENDTDGDSQSIAHTTRVGDLRALGRPKSIGSVQQGIQGTLGVLSAVVAAQLLLVVMAAQSGLATWLLVALSAVVQLPVVIGAARGAATHDRRRAREAAESLHRRSLASRADLAEGALAQAQDRIHALRTTLSSLRLSHELLVERRGVVSRATRGRLQSLHTAELERAERLLAARPAGEVTTVDLDDVLGPLVDALALRGCAVQWQGLSTQVRGRADDITEVAHILLDNAARHASGRDVAMEVTTRGGYVEVRVRDGGPGVPPSLAGRVFDRGAQGAESEGEGIGLHVARGLARELGGELWLEPQHRASGAEFVLQLPPAKGLATCLAPAV